MCRFWHPKELPIFQEKLRREATTAELYRYFGIKYPQTAIFISGTRRYLCELEDIETFLKADDTNRRKYTEDYMCGKFAFRLMGQFSVEGWAGLATGIIWTDVHALNFFIDTNSEFWFIEPQSDGIQTKLESWQGIIPWLVVM